MDVFLTIMLTGLFLYVGYLIMGRIDADLQSDSFPNKIPEAPEHVLLLYVDEKTPITSSIQDRVENWTIVPMFDAFMDTYIPFERIITFSSNDLDNLLCINNAKHRQPDCFIAARCNDRLYENLYKNIGAQLILAEDTSLEQALDHMKGRS